MAKKTVLITGCSEGGIGEALAKQYHARGFRVFATSRRASSMTSLEHLGVETLTLDVTKAESISSVKAHVEQLTRGKLDIIVNNAGINYQCAAADLTADNVRQLFETNLFSVMFMVKEFLPLLIASGDGCIVNIGSLAAVSHPPFLSAYAASKAALATYGDALRVELAPFGVKVLTVIPGFVKTSINEKGVVLPENSLYKPIEKERIAAFPQGDGTECETVAIQIVSESMKSKPRAWLWVAQFSFMVWFMSRFTPRKTFDNLLSHKFGLGKLAKIAGDKHSPQT